MYEWVQDWYSDGYYAVSPTDDPQGPDGPLSMRVVRGRGGGSWYTRLREYPYYWDNQIGLRLARDPTR